MVIPVETAPGPDDNPRVAYIRRLVPAWTYASCISETKGTDGGVLDEEHMGNTWARSSMDGFLKRQSVRAEICNLRDARCVESSHEDHTLVNVIIPETVRDTRLAARGSGTKYSIQRLKAKLVSEADVVVTNVTPSTPGTRNLEPVEHSGSTKVGWRTWNHVVVVLVADVNNTTARSLRYTHHAEAASRCVVVHVRGR